MFKLFEDFTYSVLMQRLISHFPDDLDKREGSVIWDACASAALELELAYQALDYTITQSFAIYADREFLILRAAERGITPYPATYAVIKGEFTPTNIDVTGYRFNLNKMNYLVTEKISDGVYKLECETAGSAGGERMGTLLPIEYVDGLESATATECLIPGEDEEETEHLRERYLASFTEKPFAGNIQAYIEFVTGIDGVGACRVLPIWNGPGTVKVLILDSNYSVPTSILVQTAQNEIDPNQDGTGEGLAPIGHIVTVDAPESVTCNIRAVFEFEAGYTFSGLKSQIEAVLTNYLLELRTDWGNHMHEFPTIVRISQIETRLLQITGIIDIRNTKINGVEQNLSLVNDEVPVLGSVSNG